MKVKSMKRNYIYNLVLTIVNMIFPLVTAPYLSFVLGAENIGKVNYATSVVTWFTLFAAFGIPRYGIREIARNRNDRKKFSTSFWNLLLIQGILSIVSIGVYLLIILNISIFKEDLALYAMMIITIVLNIFSIDWFYQGIEEYGYIAIRNLLLKIISIILIFVMIKEREHYLVYAFINVFGLSFNNVLNYLNTKKYIDKKIYEFKLWHYVKELKIYFMTTLIIALYTQLDQTFLGTISQRDLAYYIRSKTLLGVGTNVVNSLITVFIPRTAYLAENNYEEYKTIVQKSINYIYLLGLPCFIGLMFLAKEATLLLGGQEFLPAMYSLQVISIITLVTCIGAWQVQQILLPHKQEKLAFNIQFMSAILSVVLNIILIPKFSYMGAAIAWVITETFLVIVEGIFIKVKIKTIDIKYLNHSFIKYTVATGVMAISLAFIKLLISNYIIVILASLIISPVVYFGIIMVLKDEIVMQVLVQLKSKFIKRNKIVIER